MRGKRLLAVSVAVLLIVAFAAALFIKEGGKGGEGSGIIVVVTIPPQAEFVKRVGGEKVAVITMVPQWADPHTYEPTPAQLMNVSKAKMYVKMGSGIEFEIAWMDKIKSINENMLIVDCSKGIELLKEDGKADPHIWLSPKNAKIIVENICKGLVQIDPANSTYYEQNKEAYLRDLDALDKEISQILSKTSKTSAHKFIVYHPAWSYFARDYGLEQISVEEGGKEPTPERIASIIEEAKRNNITKIFASPQFKDKAEVIAKEIGGEVVEINPLAENYIENMRKFAEELAKEGENER
ncbi:MAG: zinc ABC transporter substrate-binding protein [Candidatus Methanospirare jalkutatii]|nr:zinc ABC transporter substrate-binding protein [Candidatus Methanospirare jalkutatii]